MTITAEREHKIKNLWAHARSRVLPILRERGSAMVSETLALKTPTVGPGIVGADEFFEVLRFNLMRDGVAEWVECDGVNVEDLA